MWLYFFHKSFAHYYSFRLFSSTNILCWSKEKVFPLTPGTYGKNICTNQRLTVYTVLWTIFLWETSPYSLFVQKCRWYSADWTCCLSLHRMHELQVIEWYSTNRILLCTERKGLRFACFLRINPILKALIHLDNSEFPTVFAPVPPYELRQCLAHKFILSGSSFRRVRKGEATLLCENRISFDGTCGIGMQVRPTVEIL